MEEKLNDLCKKLELGLFVDRETGKWTVHRQTRGSLPPEVNFTGSIELVATFVAGFACGQGEERAKSNTLRRAILEVLT